MGAVNAAIRASQDFLTAQLDAKLAIVKQEVIAEFATQLRGPLGAVAGQQQKQNEQFTGHIQSLQAASTKLEADQREPRAQVAEIRQRLHMQEAQIPIKDYENLIEWDRAADINIIVGTAAEKYTADQVKNSIQPIMDKCELNEGDWEVVGKGPARRCLIQFSGDANASARKVRAFYSKLKGPDGEWISTKVQSVHGQSTRLFFGLDRSGKTARREFQTKKFTHLCKAQDATKRKNKRSFMMQVMNSTAALALQEVHGSEAELDHEIHLRLQIKSDVSDDAAGALPNMIAIYNARNFQLTAGQVQRARGSIRAELSIAEQRPGRITVLVMGDFNFMDEAPLELTAPLVSEAFLVGEITTQKHQLLWGQALGDMVEVDPGLPTHCTEHSRQCARIDKICISSPPWLLMQWRAKVDIPAAPGALFDRGISDHAPVHLRLAARAPEGSELRPIPRHIFEIPLFAKYFAPLSGAADMGNYLPFIRLEEFKRLVREAARLTRNDMAGTPTTSRDSAFRNMQMAIQKRGKLWAPTGKVLKLKAIEVLHDHSITEKPKDMIAELRRQWSPAFQAKPSRAKHVKRYLDKHTIPYDCSQMDIPTLGKMEKIIRRLNNSAPGPDGIPCAAWKRTPSSAQLLLEASLEVMNGFPALLNFNDSLMIFTPKGSEPEDGMSAASMAK
ncbi:unnamed protein product, partial [Prorocentrum cordatum]